MKMQTRTGAVIALALGASAHADVVTWELSYNFGAVNPAGSAPWATITIDDGGGSNSATLLIQSSLVDPGEFWTGFYFNFDDALDLTTLDISHASGQAPMAGTGLSNAINIGPQNSYSVGGGSLLDIAIGFDNNAGLDRFTENEFSSYDITYSGAGSMTAASFDFTSVPGSKGAYPVVGRIQGTGFGNQGSGWISVPAPASATLIIFGVALANRRRR